MTAVFEFEMGGKTYQTGKLTPQLAAKVVRMSALMQKELALIPEEDRDTEWARTLVGSITIELMPDIFWDALSPEVKTQIGTKQDFYDGIMADSSLITGFANWCNQKKEEVSDFLPENKEVAAEVSPSPQPESTPPSAENTAGQSPSASPSAS